MSEPQKTTACQICATPALRGERHSSMSYCNWCPLWEFSCWKIVAMRVIKISAHIQKGVIGGYFCPFIFPTKNKHHNRKCTLGYFFKAPVKSRTNRQKETIQLKPNKRRQIRGLGRGERWQNSAGLLLRAKLLFWWVSFSPKSLSLKKGRMMETTLVNCQLTPFFNEFSRSLWLSYPGDSGRVSVNSSWGCQNRKMGVHFLINENNNYVQMKAKRESKELPCYFKQRRVKALS